MIINIKEGDPSEKQVVSLIDSLSSHLSATTGRDGRNSFDISNVKQHRSVFLVAWMNDQAVGCGSLRGVDNTTCEVKRMFSKFQRKGIGSEILLTLESYAIKFGYSKIWVETGIENENAVNFYQQRGYRQRENFGKYKGRSECICFEKRLREDRLSKKTNADQCVLNKRD